MIEKQPGGNQISPIAAGLRPAQARPDNGNIRGGARPGAGRRKGVPNKITNTFRDLLLQAANEVGNSEEVGKDGQGGVLGYLKVSAVNQRKTFLLMLARILPLKISAEIKQLKEKISLEEAVAELRECGLDPLLAFYLQRYPIEPDEENSEWAKLIDTTVDTTLPDIDVMTHGTENETEE